MNKSIPKLVVEVSGGNLQAIYADTELEVRLVDWDNIGAGDAEPGKIVFSDGTNAAAFIARAPFVD